MKKAVLSEAGRGDSQSPVKGRESLDRPVKRVKLEESSALDSEESEHSILDEDKEILERRFDFGGRSKVDRVTEVESALPPTQPDEEAIATYEAFKSSQAESENTASGKAKPLWIKGRSSIYVDAFNLALDTVLEEESQLFDARELDVFRQWRSLSYEPQYL